MRRRVKATRSGRRTAGVRSAAAAAAMGRGLVLAGIQGGLALAHLGHWAAGEEMADLFNQMESCYFRFFF